MGSMAKPLRNRLEKHKKLTILVIVVIEIMLFLAVGEIISRLVVKFDPSYYVGFEDKNKRAIDYPYGRIIINSYGYPDKEFSVQKTKPRIAYFGDSICYGVGAGYGFRISDILEKHYPEFEHMNFAGMGLTLSMGEIGRVMDLTSKFQIDRVVYLMNLNDIMPESDKSNYSYTIGNRRYDLAFFTRYIDWLRGRSYLYTYVRSAVKNLLERMGHRVTGEIAYELFPSKYESIFQETSSRINILNQRLAERNISFTVVLLPYEMQISSEAEKKYKQLGLSWDDSFIDESTQKEVIKGFLNITYFDAYFAFVDENNTGNSRQANGLGEFFVYNKGDKLDWNHPNKNGHQKIGEYLIEKGIFDARTKMDGR